MYIAKMVVGSPPNAFAEFLEAPAEPFPPFTKMVEFEFDEQVNLFVGPNATGKTSLLANLFDRLASGIEETSAIGSWGLIELPELHGPPEPRRRLDFSYSVAVEHFEYPEQSENLLRRLNDLPLIAIPATRVGYGSGQADQPLLRSDSKRVVAGSLSTPVYAGSVQRFVDDIRADIDALWDEIIDEWSEQPGVDPVILRANPDQILYDHSVNHYSHAPMNLKNALDMSYFCAKEICSEIITANGLFDDTIVHKSVTTAGLPDVSATLEMGTRVKTSDPAQNAANAQPLAIGQLSAGTQGTLWWIRLIALCLLKGADYQRGWAKQPAILLIDEIENHLHPTWQRRVIPALLKYFPGLQIFATTHSPFVIAGLKAGQVHLLNRDANGVITASTNTEDIVGWTADEILRVFMGVDDPTDDATASAARELRQLRDAGPHPDEREEERRQARMQELRQLVNRELLAGSVRAAEDERFAENLARVLENYRLSKDLNQENG